MAASVKMAVFWDTAHCVWSSDGGGCELHSDAGQMT